MPNKVPEQKKKAETTETLVIAVKVAPKVSKSKESGVVMRYCNCRSEFQDSRYGKGRRVFTASKKNGMRCTVCGAKQ